MTSAAKTSTAAAGRAALLKAANLRNRAGAARYLRAIGLNPHHFVIQRGIRNYAGAKCPGTGWSCTSTAHPVIQIASAGGSNTFQCSTASCAVVQVAAAPAKPNKASCVKTTGVGASCSISQASSAGNQAIVWEDAGKLTGLTQTALYSASITQKATGSGAANTACVHQQIVIDGSTKNTSSTGATVALEAHQSIGITQDSSSGGNTVQDASQPVNGVPGCVALPTSCPQDLLQPCGLSQTQILSSTATSKGAVVQNENKTDTGPNLTLNIKQNQSSGFVNSAQGQNFAVFTQTNNLSAVANAPAGATQWQSSPNGGILAAVSQDSRDVSTAIARQKETQCEDAQPSGLTGCDLNDQDKPPGYTLTQTQYGPVRKTPGDSSQTGNGDDSFSVIQNSRQDNDTGSGQTNVVSGGFHTDGTGTVSQTTTVNGQTSTDTQAGTGDVSGNLNCTGSSCTSTPPPPPTINSHPDNPTSSPDATFTFSDADSSATFLCQLDGGGYSSCTSPKTYTALDPGSHTFSVEAKNPTTAEVSDATPFTWTISSNNANVLIAGAGNEFSGGTAVNDNIAQALTSAGYSVTELATLPEDLSSYGQVWWVDTSPPTSAEETQLINFAESGKGVFLTGENDGCCSSLNAGDQSMVNSIVTGAGITVGGQSVCCAGTPVAYNVNSSVVGNLATQPHIVTSWTATLPGGISGMPDSSVFAYYQPGDLSTRQDVAAAWDPSSTVGSGRLVIFMDINWTDSGLRGANWSDVAENVAFFLSGLSSPPSVIP
jgi:hypothetical protein